MLTLAARLCFPIVRLVDNLPSATKYEVPKTGEVFYDLGYKIGWVSEDGKVSGVRYSNINNIVNIKMDKCQQNNRSVSPPFNKVVLIRFTVREDEILLSCGSKLDGRSYL